MTKQYLKCDNDTFGRMSRRMKSFIYPIPILNIRTWNLLMLHSDFNGGVLIKNSLLLSHHVPIFSTCTIRLASLCKLTSLMTRRPNKSCKLNDLRIHGEGCPGARLHMNSSLSISWDFREIFFKISGWCLHLEVGAQSYRKFWISHLYTYVSFNFFICAELLPCVMVKVRLY